jgi:hypothetical protein
VFERIVGACIAAGDDGSLDSDDPTFSGTLIRRAER